MSRPPKKTEAATVQGAFGGAKDPNLTQTSPNVVELNSEEDAERALKRLKALLVTAGKEVKAEDKTGKKGVKHKERKKDKVKFDAKMFDVDSCVISRSFQGSLTL